MLEALFIGGILASRIEEGYDVRFAPRTGPRA